MFWDWLAEILCHSAILGWAAEHFENDSQKILHNSVDAPRCTKFMVLAHAFCEQGHREFQECKSNCVCSR